MNTYIQSVPTKDSFPYIPIGRKRATTGATMGGRDGEVARYNDKQIRNFTQTEMAWQDSHPGDLSCIPALCSIFNLV